MSWGEERAFMDKAELVNNWWKFSSSRQQASSSKMHIKVQRLLTRNTMLRPKEMSVDGKLATSANMTQNLSTLKDAGLDLVLSYLSFYNLNSFFLCPARSVLDLVRPFPSLVRPNGQLSTLGLLSRRSSFLEPTDRKLRY